MWVRDLIIQGFRGIRDATLSLGERTVLIGPNGSGKSTIVEALCLVLGRDRMVRSLTEHDFTGCNPSAADRIKIVATVVGFDGDDPEQNPSWFRSGASIVRWWNEGEGVHARRSDGDRLCAQIGFAARFDHEDVQVETVRYFVDHSVDDDPFLDESLTTVPRGIVRDLGFYVLPARRDRSYVLSFGSSLFRAAVAQGGGLPGPSVIRERDRVRVPQEPLEQEEPLATLAESLNKRLKRLDPSAPSFQLRLTATDSQGLLDAMVPHYATAGGPSLPAFRHGSGLVSLQTLLLLGEMARGRAAEGRGFLIAVEEPELHVPPGSQRRVIQEASQDAQQIICTTHSPRVASFFHAHEVRVVEVDGENVAARPLLKAPLTSSSRNQERVFFVDQRERVVEALMYPMVLIPEGRLDQNWLRLLVGAVETSTDEHASFGSLVGVIPTPKDGPPFAYDHLSKIRSGIAVLVDGDEAGSRYARLVNDQKPPPTAVVQWPPDWAIEQVVTWVMKGDEQGVVEAVSEVLDSPPEDFSNLAEQLSKPSRQGGLKEHFMFHEELAGIIGRHVPCRRRASDVLDALLAAVRGEEDTRRRRAPKDRVTRIQLA